MDLGSRSISSSTRRPAARVAPSSRAAPGSGATASNDASASSASERHQDPVELARCVGRHGRGEHAETVDARDEDESAVAQPGDERVPAAEAGEPAVGLADARERLVLAP